MGVPDTANWKSLPGNFDVLKMQQRFEGEKKFGLPIIFGENQFQPESVHLWTERTKIGDEEIEKGAWHFFTDDYRFEPVWNKPQKYLMELDRVSAVMTPDFSMYLEWPRVAQIWNTYRGRWLGAYWESKGYSVIPTVTWGDWTTFDFCFASIREGATVAISTMGVSPVPEERSRFSLGYYVMCETIKPSLVLIYGEQWEKLGIKTDVPVARYAPTGVLEMRARLQNPVNKDQLLLPVIGGD